MRNKPVRSAGFDISDFADVRHGPPTSTELSPECFGYYRAYEKGTDNEIGRVQYRFSFDDDDILIIISTYTEPAWRSRKIATALIERLHEDHGQHFVHVGRDHPDELPTPAFYYYLRDALPDYRDTVIQEGAREDGPVSL